MELPSEIDSFSALLALLALSTKNSIEANAPLLHEAVYNLRENKSFNKFFGNYFFQRRGSYHYSRDLEVDFGNLELSFLLSNKNPSLSVYTIEDKIKSAFEKYTKPKISPESLGELEAMAAEFSKCI